MILGGTKLRSICGQWEYAMTSGTGALGGMWPKLVLQTTVLAKVRTAQHLDMPTLKNLPSRLLRLSRRDSPTKAGTPLAQI